MTKPLSHLLPQFKLGKGRVPEIESEETPSVSRALLNDIINKRTHYEANASQINQKIYHLCLAYGDLLGIKRRFWKLMTLSIGKEKALLAKKRELIRKVLEEFPLRIT